jgi:hypothetical protein
MAEAPSHIARVLGVLAANSELIAEAMQGLVMVGGKSDRGIEALVHIHALTPVEEDTYQLNPRLREYLSDHLARWDAFSRLTRLSSDISQARVLWRNLRQFAREGLHGDVERLGWALDATITSIGYAMERNLMLLNSNISTEYGNVESLKAKIEQNTHYASEVSHCLREIRSLDEATQAIHDEALAAGNLAIRTLINTRIRSRLTTWASKLNDIQREIEKRLFTARLLERRLRTLGKVALWLNRDRLSNGFEVEGDEEAAAKLGAPAEHPNSWSIDTRDHDAMVQDGLVMAVARLPERKARTSMSEQEPALQEVLATEQQVAELLRDPADVMVEELLEHLRRNPAEKVSLLQWRMQAMANAQAPDHSLDDVQAVCDEHWLLYAASQVATAGMGVQLTVQERVDGLHNDLFSDITVQQEAAVR